MNILIIEDDPLFLQTLQGDLKGLGFNVTAKSTLKINQVSDYKTVDIAIIDMHLPGISGLELISEFSKYSVKTIMLTCEDDLQLEHDSLVAGAADYIVKPYYLATLELKIKRLIKNDNVIIIRGNNLNLKTMILNGRVKLTDNEFRVLSLLMTKQGNIVKKSDILDLLWDNDCFIELNSLNVLISRLRTKIKRENLVIHTIKGKGYIIE